MVTSTRTIANPECPTSTVDGRVVSEKPQEIRAEIDAWERRTGYSAETTYNTPRGVKFSDMTEEQRQEGTALWKRYLWKRYQDALGS